MREENLEELQRLSMKFLPRMDANLMRGILLALILLSDEEKGEELKKFFKKFLDKDETES